MRIHTLLIALALANAVVLWSSAEEPLAKVEKTEAEWRAQLTPVQYAVMCEGKTERAGSCPLLKEHRAGVFRCVGCGAAIFASDGKFESGTGWPSFFKPVDEKNFRTVDDHSFGMERKEILCARCGSHLGHVFDDGPKPSGLRYCINGVALNFEPRE